MCQVNALRGQHACQFDRLRRIITFFLKLANSALHRTFLTGRPIEDRIKNLKQESVLVIVSDDGVVAMLEILFCGLSCRLQCGYDFGIVRLPVVDGLILENQKEPSCDGITGTDRLDQTIIIKLEFATLRVGLNFHISLDCVEVFPNVCFLGENLYLNLYRRDLHPACEGRHDILLFTHTSEEEIDRFHLQDLDIPTVCRLNDSVSAILHRDEVLTTLRMLTRFRCSCR